MDKKQKHFSIGYFFITLLIMWLFNDLVFRPLFIQETEVSYSQFLQYLQDNKVSKVTLGADRFTFYLKEGVEGARTVRNAVRVDDPGLVKRLEDAKVDFSGVKQTQGFLEQLMGWVVAFLPLILIWYFVFRRMSGGAGSVLSFGKSNVQEIQGEMTGVKFEDVGGVGEAETELREIIEYLKDSSRFDRLGAKLPKGVLLVGPPGTGKTLLAKATAGESGVPFFSLTGSSFVEMFVGVGAARVRDLFEQAKKKAPCIIFIDEIDAIGQARSTIAAMSGNSERENTLNQLLAEMDGFQPNSGVVIMAATNRPEILDQALVRPGRFDRQIQVTLPTEAGRLEVLKIHARNIPMNGDTDLKRIAKITSGFSGADLANIINEASLLAVRREAKNVEMEDLDLAIERVVAGLQKKTPLSPQIRRKVAYHEVGHALSAHYLNPADPVHKISIIPTAKGALGYTMQMPEEDQYLITEEELKTRMAVMLGGRAAELLIFNESSTGASNDLERVTMLARRMITEFGMSEKLGPVRYSNTEGMYLQTGSTNRTDLSPETLSCIDEEIRGLLKEAQQSAMNILIGHRAVLDAVAELLQEKEVILGEEIKKIAASFDEGHDATGGINE